MLGGRKSPALLGLGALLVASAQQGVAGAVPPDSNPVAPKDTSVHMGHHTSPTVGPLHQDFPSQSRIEDHFFDVEENLVTATHLGQKGSLTIKIRGAHATAIKTLAPGVTPEEVLAELEARTPVLVPGTTPPRVNSTLSSRVPAGYFDKGVSPFPANGVAEVTLQTEPGEKYLIVCDRAPHTFDYDMFITVNYARDLQPAHVH